MQSLCITGATLWTGKEARPEADTILTCGKILAVGRYEDVARHPALEYARVLNLNGETVVPGLSDCHLHLLAYAKQKIFADLSGAKNVSEMLEILREQARSTGPGEWICGFNFNETNWGGEAMPDGRDLDSLGLPGPVLIQRICTHATVLNSHAMRKCGLDRSDDSGVLKDSSGKTGVVVEEAQAVAHAAMRRAMLGRQRMLELLRLALDECASYGLTAIYTCGAASLGMEEDMSLYQELRTGGDLKARVFAFHDALPMPEMTTGFGDKWIGYQGHKIFIDGSLGARTAALSQPYSDAPEKKGVLLHSTKDLADLLAHLDTVGCQALVHAIGDAALDQLLDAMESARGGARGNTAAAMPPVLVNHCMICRPEQIERMSRLGVNATIQPTFVQSDRAMAPPRLGERIGKGWAYPWRSLADAGIVLNGSSDCPIESLDPWSAIWAAVERKEDENSVSWMPGQCLSVDEALGIYTRNPARNSGTDAWRGTLEEGKEADIAVLDRNILDRPPSGIRGTRAISTVTGGRIVHGEENWRPENAA